MALSPAEKQAANRARQATEIKKLQAAHDRVAELQPYVQILKNEIRVLRDRTLSVANSSASKRMTAPEYRFIRGLLHPDNDPEDQERFDRAFEIFNRIPEPKTQKRR
jgi:hypothetical protein